MLNLKKIILLPVWFFALFSAAKSFSDNPMIGSSFLNKLGLHTARIRIAASMAQLRRAWLAKRILAGDKAAYDADGFIVKKQFLSEDSFAQLSREVLDSMWPLREMRQGCAVTRRVFLDVDTLKTKAPVLAAFIQNNELISLMRYAAGIGGQPIFSIQAIFNDTSGAEDPQTFIHSDTFHSNAKAWFFIEDVAEDGGPFGFVAGSHQLTPPRLNWERRQSLNAAHHPVIYHARGSFRATLDDLAEMQLPQLTKFAVAKNTLVIADTRGFHCRVPSSKATFRIEIYATLRRNPFLPWIGLHFLSLPYIKSRLGTLSIRLLSQLQSIGLGKMSWRAVGEGNIKEAVRS